MERKWKYGGKISVICPRINFENFWPCLELENSIRMHNAVVYKDQKLIYVDYR